MLRFRSFSFKVVQRHTAASSSTRPCSTGQHLFTTGSPNPTCTNPFSRSTQAPSFSVSIGHVAGGAGHGVFPPPLLGVGGFRIGTGGSGGRSTGGLIGGSSTGGLIGGSSTGGLIGGRSTGGLIGGSSTGGLIGGKSTGGLIGGTVTGGNVTGGLMGGTVIGGKIPGGLTAGGFLAGLCFLGGLPMPQ